MYIGDSTYQVKIPNSKFVSCWMANLQVYRVARASCPLWCQDQQEAIEIVILIHCGNTAELWFILSEPEMLWKMYACLIGFRDCLSACEIITFETKILAPMQRKHCIDQATWLTGTDLLISCNILLVLSSFSNPCLTLMIKMLVF